MNSHVPADKQLRFFIAKLTVKNIRLCIRFEHETFIKHWKACRDYRYEDVYVDNEGPVERTKYS
ncbi:hypothetical protein GQ600_14315 [Phytophthora cactorum]|nr:hypothetical protein GQ600_14315 [Phytophthora cactorum]